MSGLLARPEELEATIPIQDEWSLALVRNRISELGQAFALSDQTIATASLIATELGQNQLKYAQDGNITVSCVERLAKRGMKIHASDHGPGIADPGQALMPGPREKSLHAGLAAVVNLSDELAIDDRLDEGLLVSAIKYDDPPQMRVECGLYGRPIPEEFRSGDDAAFCFTDSGFILAIGDGFGHGALARESSQTAIGFIQKHASLSLEEIMSRLGSELRDMRGLMICVARFDARRGVLEVVGAGDVSGVLHREGQNLALFFRAGPVVSRFRPSNYKSRRIRTEAGDILIVHTDGVREAFDLTADRMLARRPAVEIAHQLVEKFGRETDDALAAVVRFL